MYDKYNGGVKMEENQFSLQVSNLNKTINKGTLSKI